MSTRTCRCGQPVQSTTLCSRCTLTLDVAIGHISVYYRDLDTLRTRQARYAPTANGGKGGTKSQPIGVDYRFVRASDVDEAVEYQITSRDGRTYVERTVPGKEGQGTQVIKLTHTLISRFVRATMRVVGTPLEGPVCVHCLHRSCADLRRRRAPRANIGSCCSYLQANLRAIITQPGAIVMLDQLLDLEHQLRRLVDRPAEREYIGACWTCDIGVYAYRGDEYGTCEGCGTEYDTAGGKRGLERELDSKLCTAAEIADLATYLGLPADRDKIRKRINLWHHRGRIVAQGTDDTELVDDKGEPTRDPSRGRPAPRFAYGTVRTLLYIEFSTEKGA